MEWILCTAPDPIGGALPCSLIYASLQAQTQLLICSLLRFVHMLACCDQCETRLAATVYVIGGRGEIEVKVDYVSTPQTCDESIAEYGPWLAVIRASRLIRLHTSNGSTRATFAASMRTTPIKSCTAYLQLSKRFCCYSQPPVASCEESEQRIDRLDRLVSSDIELTAHPARAFGILRHPPPYPQAQCRLETLEPTTRTRNQGGIPLITARARPLLRRCPGSHCPPSHSRSAHTLSMPPRPKTSRSKSATTSTSSSRAERTSSGIADIS